MTTDNLTLTVNLKVCCGAGSHDATLTLTAWGMVEFFTPCFLLPLTVRKLSDCNCDKFLLAMAWELAQDFYGAEEPFRWLTELSDEAWLWLEASSQIPLQAQEFAKRWQGRLMEGAMEKLAQEGFDPPTENALRAALHSGDRHLRCAAAVLAGARKQTSLIPDLLEAAQEQSSFCLQLAVLWALTGMPDSRALNFLCRNLHCPALRTFFRVRVVRALGQIGGSQAVEHLIAALHNGDEKVRRAAAKELGFLRDVCAIPPLIRALKYDIRIRDAVAQALLSFGKLAIPHLIAALDDRYHHEVVKEVLAGFGEVAVAPLIEALRRGSEAVREGAAKALGKIKDARAIKPLIEALGDFVIRKSVIDALVSIGKPAVTPLIKALRDDNHLIRWGAAEVLGRLKNLRAVRPLLDALKDGVAYDALKGALVAIGEPAVTALVEALKDNAPLVRRAAVEALAELKGVHAIQWLAEMLRDEKIGVREATVRTLGKLGDARTIPSLIEALKDSSREVRLAAVEALQKFQDERVVAALMEALKDRSKVVRIAAARALGNLGDRRAVLSLLEALNDKDTWLRVAVIEALGKLNDERAIMPLLEALMDETSQVRQAAMDALLSIGKPAVVPLLDMLEKTGFAAAGETLLRLPSDILKEAMQGIEDGRKRALLTEIFRRRGGV
jgi:HEAT repeat protein